MHGAHPRSSILRVAFAVAAAIASSTLSAPHAIAGPAAAPPETIPALSGSPLAVDAVASNHVWVVGTHPDPADPDENNGLAVHWDGSTWTEFPTPSLQPLTGGLVAVSLSSSTDGFAVGNKGIKGFRDQQVVVERWTGKKWTLSNAPDQSFNDVLSGVASLSPTDAWAVGAWDPGGTARNRPLIEHWDGASWSIVTVDDPVNAVLTSVTAVAANDVWAVGDSGGKTLVMHWDGSAWSRVSSPNDGSATQGLSSVSAAGPNDIWAVGTIDEGSPFPGETLAIHWNGAAWKLVTTPSPPSGDTVTGVAAFANRNAWMVGSYWSDAFTNHGLALRLHASRTRLTKIPGNNSLNGVDGVAKDDVYAVGGGIFHWNGTRWKQVATEG